MHNEFMCTILVERPNFSQILCYVELAYCLLIIFVIFLAFEIRLETKLNLHFQQVLCVNISK